MPKRAVKKPVDEVRQPAKPKATAFLTSPEQPAAPPKNAQRTSADKYFYLWGVALIAFGIGLLTGYGIGFKRYAPELIDQYLSTSNARVSLATLKAAGENFRNLVPPPPPSDSDLVPPPAAADEETLIEAWLKAQGLNAYGDPPETVYAGGTPLFNEATGESLDRVQYLKAKFPNEPWRSQ